MSFRLLSATVIVICVFNKAKIQKPFEIACTCTFVHEQCIWQQNVHVFVVWNGIYSLILHILSEMKFILSYWRWYCTYLCNLLNTYAVSVQFCYVTQWWTEQQYAVLYWSVSFDSFKLLILNLFREMLVVSC